MKILKTLNGKGIFKNDSIWFPVYYCFNTLWNYSDASLKLAKVDSYNWISISQTLLNWEKTSSSKMSRYQSWGETLRYELRKTFWIDIKDEIKLFKILRYQILMEISKISRYQSWGEPFRIWVKEKLLDRYQRWGITFKILRYQNWGEISKVSRYLSLGKT